jgi:predicted MFS family arabinose efflux permease
MIVPLESEFGWSRTTISIAVGINILLFGLVAPFAAALMERFGLRRVTTFALVIIAAGAALSIFVTASWQLILTWGILIGVGSGSMALVFVATVVDRWFVAKRGLVTGILTAGSATGQLVFLPLMAWLVDVAGWRQASLLVAGAAIAVVPLVLIFLRNSPTDLGTTRLGETPEASRAQSRSIAAALASGMGPAKRAISVLVTSSRNPTFWALAAGFAICGASTNGLIGVHFIPSAHDHGMPETTAAGLLAVIGLFDIVGTVLSGWLTDRVNPRILLAIYYAGRGLSLLVLPLLLSSTLQPSLIIFIIFYGLDWVATVPPTIALCREVFGESGPIVFGWVFAAHQVGAALAAIAAGLVRDATGEYTYAWIAAALLCAVAAAVSISIRRTPDSVMSS